MSTVEGFFTDRGVAVDEALLVQALTDLLDDRLTRADGVALPEADDALLRQHSGVRPSNRSVPAAHAGAGAAVTELVAHALTVDDAAERAGVHPSRVRHWIGDGAVQAVKVGGRNLLPAWQFAADGRPLPGLAAALEALPADLHPLSVAGFFTTPEPELVADGQEMTPVEWLGAGGDPAPVVALAGALAVLL